MFPGHPLPRRVAPGVVADWPSGRRSRIFRSPRWDSVTNAIGRSLARADPSAASSLSNARPAGRVRASGLSDREVFGCVYRQMRSLAGALAPDLEDLVQAAAEQVFRCRDGFEGRSEFSTWVYSICYRVLLNHRRWYRRWSLRFILGAEQTHVPAAIPLASSLLEERERLACLHRAIARMGNKYRVVVVLHDLEGLAVSDIAGIVDANENTVRSRLRDGRKQLFKLLQIEQTPDQHGDTGELIPHCSP